MLQLRYTQNFFKPLVIIILYGCCLCSPGGLDGQSDSVWWEAPEVTFHGFVDIFYAFDLDRPRTEKRQDFLFNHNRHNEFNLNLGILGMHLKHSRYRAHLDLQSGTYANDNYAAEPGVLKNVFQANAGLALDKQARWWIDVGIFPSHLGFESALSIDNLTLTRSLAAENSPYFLSGARLSFEPNEKWYLALIATNGWQRIRRLPGNSLLSWGTQITYRAGDDLSINWSTFIGTDDPDTDRRIRIFNDLYTQFQIGDKIEMIAGIDVGLQQKEQGNSGTDLWWVPTLVVQYSVNERWSLAGRVEHFQDPAEAIVNPPGQEGFETTGASIGLDYRPVAHVACRLEARWLTSPDEIYPGEGGSDRRNSMIAASMAIKW